MRSAFKASNARYLTNQDISFSGLLVLPYQSIPSFSNAVSHTIFVAPAVEVGLKYEWLTKDNINGYARHRVVSIQQLAWNCAPCLTAKVVMVRTSSAYNSHAKIPCFQDGVQITFSMIMKQRSVPA